MSIRNKAILLMTLLILLICGVFVALIYRQGQQNLQQLIESKVTAASQVSESVLSQIRQQYQRRIKSFINYEASQTRARMLQAFAERDKKELLDLSKPFLNILKRENPHFISLGWILPDNKTFLRVHLPDSEIEDVGERRADVAAVNLKQVQYSGFTSGGHAPQFRVVQPVFYQGEYLGAVQMGIDAQVIVDILQQKLHLSAAFSVPTEKNSLDAGSFADNLTSGANTIQTSERGLFERLVDKVNWEILQQKVLLNEQVFVLHKVLALNDFLGKRFGCLFVAIDITKITAETRKILNTTIILSLLLLLFLAVIFYYSFGSLLGKIVNLNESLEKSNRELEERVEERTRALTEEIGERKIAEEKLQRAEKMEAIGLMASGVAHDLNNILSGVVSYPELLLMRLPEDSKLRQPITSIRESGLRAAAVVEDLLTVARDAAKVRTRADINSLILEYLQSPEAEKLQELYADVTITTALGKELPKVCCSPSHVNKCIMNLVMNAAEAQSLVGTINISSSVLTLPNQSMADVVLPAGDYVVLEVEDSGPGISEDDLAHVFEPFYTKKNMGRSGTGIGLAVVWNCMEDHGGMVRVKSDSQQGTVFSLLFPVGADADCTNAITKMVVSNVNGAGETILIVDDEAHQRDIATQILDELGYQTEAVCCGEEAIAYIKKHKVDLLLLDMLMEPGLDGCETFAEIVRICPAQKAVIVSGYAESERMEKTLDFGAAGFLKKPYTIDQLGIAVSAALKKESLG